VSTEPLPTPDPVPLVCARTQLPPAGVAAVLRLLGEGNTVPFVARYRKEATGGLDEVAIAAIEEANKAVTALEKRRAAIRAAIAEQGQLTPELERRLLAVTDARALEDLYLPYKRKRTTRAAAARARGLGPLARRILGQPSDGRPEQEARRFVQGEVADVDAALAGARDIVAEEVAERTDVRARVRELTAQHGRLRSKAIKKATEGKRTRFEDYYDFEQPLGRVPGHRLLAIERGEGEGVLRVGVAIDADRMGAQIERITGLRPRSPWAVQLGQAIAEGYKRLIKPSIDKEVRSERREQAAEEAATVFAANLRNLLLSAPYGPRPVIGVDPGFRSGCKCAALDGTGKLLDHVTIDPHTRRDDRQAREALVRLVRRGRADAVAIGNGTAGRETLAFATAALREAGLTDVIVVSVNEAGASVYSASEIAREEFGQLDLTVRGAISIGRRLQDPLSELVKVDPRSLGVGQYQHDIPEKLLAERLAAGVGSCVNHVGVELNSASAPLLEHVSGIGPVLARRIVQRRDAAGAFGSRRELMKVPGLGAKTFEQAAGFLRIRSAANPLDDSAVHPERYGLVRTMARDLGVEVGALVGESELLAGIDLRRYVGGDVGVPTLKDILDELAQPGRDPREAFEPPRFRDGVNEVGDLVVGMRLEGVVTNVTSFGAFVDIGVHQDGLVHVSKLSDRFVRDPHEVVRAGQRVAVKVLAVDLERERISLSIRDA
jgi:protein Tex